MFSLRRKISALEIGTRVRPVGRTIFGDTLPMVYRVESFFTGTDGIAYARLRSTTETGPDYVMVKTVSSAVLYDTKRFEILPSGGIA